MNDVRVRKSNGNKPTAKEVPAKGFKKKKKWYKKKETASKKKATQRDLESFAEQFNRKNHRH